MLLFALNFDILSSSGSLCISIKKKAVYPGDCLRALHLLRNNACRILKCCMQQRERETRQQGNMNIGNAR